MPRGGSDTRKRIIEVAYELFYRGGFARVGVDAIAEAAGITKRTLYYHFDGKDALLAAVLDAQHGMALSRIQRWAARASGDPERMVEAVFTELAAWSRRPEWRGSGFTRVAMELADLPSHPARVAAHRHKAAVEDWFAEELARGGAGRPRELARQLVLLVEGCLSLLLIHGDAGYVESAAAAARRLVERDAADRAGSPPEAAGADGRSPND